MSLFIKRFTNFAKRKVAAIAAVAVLAVPGILMPASAHALASTFNPVGTYTVAFTCVTGCSGTYDHTMSVNSYNTTSGAFTGNGYYNADPSYTWDLTGTLSGSNVAYHLLYTGTEAGYTLDAIGTVASDGTMSGTANDSLARTLTWATTAGAASTSTTNNYTVSPWTYVGAAGDCGLGYPAGTPGNVVSKWDNTTGNPAPSLYLQKNAATSDCSSAGATVNGVNGITLSELNFDYKNGEYCGAGAPRFNVVTSDDVTHFFGCASGTATNLNNGWTHVVFDPTNPAQAFPVIASGTTVKTIDIVFDEQGSTHIDNISVNNQVVGAQSTPFTKEDCKNGGYVNFVDENGQPFKNQGQCVAYFNRGAKGSVVKNKTTINVNNVTNQSARSGRAVVRNNTTGGNATSGNASNSNSNSNTVTVSNNISF